MPAIEGRQDRKPRSNPRAQNASHSPAVRRGAAGRRGVASTGSSLAGADAGWSSVPSLNVLTVRVSCLRLFAHGIGGGGGFLDQRGVLLRHLVHLRDRPG